MRLLMDVLAKPLLNFKEIGFLYVFAYNMYVTYRKMILQSFENHLSEHRTTFMYSIITLDTNELEYIYISSKVFRYFHIEN